MKRPSWQEEGEDPDYRFSLANERTFLAWIRTALDLLAGGLLIANEIAMRRKDSLPHNVAVFVAGMAIAVVAALACLLIVRQGDRRMKEPAMKTRTVLCAVLAGFAFTGSAGAVTKVMELPPETAQLGPSPLPGYVKAQANCVACHSAEYMLYQPPSAPRGYWDNMVKRMKNVFKAPIADADMPVIVDYLVKTRGAEQPK